VVGFVDDRDPPSNVLGASVLGQTDDLPRLIETHQVDEVIVAMPEASHQDILSIITRCEREKVTIKVFPDVFQIMASEVSIGDLNGLPLLTVRDIALRGWRLALKRAMDILGSGLSLLVFSPIMLLVAILIKLDSPGSVFYVQERMGLDARPFLMFKFRSMRPDAEANTGPVWATHSDPRRTRIGTIIRRFSVDELPQLINVLLGDMSLVGPRPERPIFVEQFKRSIPRYMDRHKEKAGMTGWAQVNGLRGDTSIIERTKYDLWYIENWSLLLDFKILARTLTSVFLDRHAL
jgi:Undecaprenyl-phosphate glucose phosphotransferase